MAATFLDALSVDAVVNILRFFSDHPRASNWESYVQMEVLFVLYCSSGRLSEICREHFTEVCIDGGDEAHATALTLRKRESFLCNKEKLEKKRMRMMQIGAQNIAKLFAYRPLFRGTHKRLINLKELELVHTSHDVANILNGLPSQLDALYLRFALSKMQIDAIAMYCKRLCKLETQLGEHDFEKLFESVGPGLEHFAVHFYSRKLSSKNLFHIKKYCRNLYSLGLGYFPTSDAQDVTDLVVSYSTNLDTLKLGSDLSLEQYRRIASNCLEVDCTVECDVEKIVDVMMGLQDRFLKLATTVWDEDVEVDGDDDAFYGGYYGEEYNRKPFDIHFLVPVEKLTAAALKCTRLRELNLSGEAQSMQNVLHAIAPQLRTGLEILEINSHTQDMPNDPEPWDPENVLPNLREFVFRCSSHSFECFLDLGRALPLIETVEIVGDAEDNDPYDEPTFAGHIFGGAVDALRYCLKDVYIGSVHSFEYHRLSHLWYLYKTESIIAEYKTKTPSPCVHVYGRRCVPGDLHLGW